MEAIVSYQITDALSVGVGGRYWAMWADGSFTCTGCDAANPGLTSTPANPQRVSAERYGLLLQGAYKFNAPPEILPMK
jgi:hypothetical protein